MVQATDRSLVSGGESNGDGARRHAQSRGVGAKHLDGAAADSAQSEPVSDSLRAALRRGSERRAGGRAGALPYADDLCIGAAARDRHLELSWGARWAPF